MRNARNRAGYNLLEVVIASSIFGLLIAMLMGMFGRAMGSAEMDLNQTHIEGQVQDAVDRIIQDLKETTPAKVTFYQFVEDGRAQTAFAFPCARDQNDSFIYRSGGAVQNQPVWQSIRVYCYITQPGINGGFIRRYDDYTLRSYTNSISVTNITATTITLSDGTKFQRDGTVAANQKILVLGGLFVQLEAAVPVMEEAVDFAIDPDLIEDAIQDQEVRPLRLTIRSEVAHRFPGLVGGSVVTTLTNEVLSRNRN